MQRPCFIIKPTNFTNFFSASDVYFVNDNLIGFIYVNKTIIDIGRSIHCAGFTFNEPLSD